MSKPVLHGLVKWYAQFRTSQFLPGIAFIVFKNQFHAPKNGREHCESKPETERLLETGIKDGFEEGVTNFHLEYPTGKIQCRTNFNF